MRELFGANVLKDYSTIRAPLSAALNKSRIHKENMLTFVFYFIFELKFHQKIMKNYQKWRTYGTYLLMNARSKKG